MNIVICLKQVPGTTSVDIDPETGVLKRSGVPSKMNPYDLYTIETAISLRETYGGKITAITMGPPQAEEIIREAYMMGVDDGILMTDRKFSGADVLATSKALSSGIRCITDFDLIICGKQTTDGDTAQVGPAIAEHLSIPHVTWVSRIDKADTSGIIVEQNMADSLEVVRLEFPCLITVEKDINTPRLPSYLNMKKSKDREVRKLGLEDLQDTTESKYGLSGSPTQVEKIFQPEADIEQIIWDNASVDGAQLLFDMLSSNKFITGVN